MTDTKTQTTPEALDPTAAPAAASPPQAPEKGYLFSETEWTQRSYHGDNIYGNLDRFIKISLAIAGGMAYLAVNEPKGNPEFVSLIVRAGAYIWFGAGVLCVANIVCHFTFLRFQMTPASDRVRLKLLATAEFWMILFISASAIGGLWAGHLIADRYIDAQAPPAAKRGAVIAISDPAAGVDDRVIADRTKTTP